MTYTVTDGLAHNTVAAIAQDSQGYTWFATFEGVSRFDGYEFTRFGVDDGLPHPLVTGVPACRCTPDRRSDPLSLGSRIPAASRGWSESRLQAVLALD